VSWIEAIVLALVQGLTEFLPVSSSAHLILIPLLTGWEDQGLAFDIAVHFGTLLAVVWYFRQDLSKLSIGWWGSLRYGKHTPESRLAWGIGLATIPVGLAGLAFKPLIETHFRSGLVMAFGLIVFGLLLGYADWRYSRQRRQPQPPALSNEYQVSAWQITVIALAQALALIPGTSRSGITLTAGLLVGLSREASARFSFLLSIPVIVLASMLQVGEALTQPVNIQLPVVLVGVIVAALSAYACISVFLQLIKKTGLQPFVVYRLLLGGYLLYLFS